jgi:hypothetical protein
LAIQNPKSKIQNFVSAPFLHRLASCAPNTKNCGFKKIALQALPSSLQGDIFISLGLFRNKVQGHDR